jgi:hypothetical protein
MANFDDQTSSYNENSKLKNPWDNNNNENKKANNYNMSSKSSI